MNGGQTAAVARVESVHQIKGLTAANLTNNQSVGPHAKGIADEISDCQEPNPFSRFGAALKPDDVWVTELEFSCILDRYEPFTRPDIGRNRVE